jgi:hypothetical protein
MTMDINSKVKSGVFAPSCDFDKVPFLYIKMLRQRIKILQHTTKFL